MDVIARKYPCPRCAGTGEIESSDSTEDGWWDCRTCEGTGKLADRRRPDPQLAGAVERASTMHAEFVAERRMLREALAEYGETDERLAARYAALRGQ